MIFGKTFLTKSFTKPRECVTHQLQPFKPIYLNHVYVP